MNLRYKTQNDYSPIKQWNFLCFRLIYWPMWKDISIWNLSEWRINFKYKFFMVGAFELRVENF